MRRLVLAGRVERLDVDDHHLHPGVGAEPLQLVELRRAVDERSGLGAVYLLEVLGCHVERLLHALADRHRRHDHDELAPAVALVQLHDRLDVDVGLAGPRLHLDVEVRSAGRGLTVLQLVREWEVAGPLHNVDVVQQLLRGQGDLGVPQARVRGCARLEQGRGGGRLLLARVDPVGDPVVLRLAREDFDDGIDRVGLVLLDLELELHPRQIAFTSVEGEISRKICSALIRASSDAKPESRKTARRAHASQWREPIRADSVSKQAMSASSSTTKTRDPRTSPR